MAKTWHVLVYDIWYSWQALALAMDEGLIAPRNGSSGWRRPVTHRHTSPTMLCPRSFNDLLGVIEAQALFGLVMISLDQ